MQDALNEKPVVVKKSRAASKRKALHDDDDDDFQESKRAVFKPVEKPIKLESGNIADPPGSPPLAKKTRTSSIESKRESSTTRDSLSTRESSATFSAAPSSSRASTSGLQSRSSVSSLPLLDEQQAKNKFKRVGKNKRAIGLKLLTNS